MYNIWIYSITDALADSGNIPKKVASPHSADIPDISEHQFYNVTLTIWVVNLEGMSSLTAQARKVSRNFNYYLHIKKNSFKSMPYEMSLTIQVNAVWDLLLLVSPKLLYSIADNTTELVARNGHTQRLGQNQH